VKVLTLGSDTQAKELFPADTEFSNYADREKKNYYDAVFLGHHLQTLDRKEVPQLLKELYPVLKEDGELYVSVPSLEFAALQILKDDNPNFSYFTALWGGDDNPHKCGFRLLDLRLIVQNTGYLVRRAIQEAYQESINGQPVLTMQNLVIAVKHAGNAEDAIE
jgi:SAM-dependent methyltransferase